LEDRRSDLAAATRRLTLTGLRDPSAPKPFEMGLIRFIFMLYQRLKTKLMPMQVLQAIQYGADYTVVLPYSDNTRIAPNNRARN
jgi:hypothetical protein